MNRWFSPEDTTHIPERPPRPAGVSILTIWFGITAGLMPVILMTISLTQQAVPEEQNTFACIPLVLSAGVIFTAIGTWRGHDPSRLGFIIFVLVYYSIALFNEYSSVRMGIYTDDSELQAIGRILRYVVFILVNTWYFLRPKTIEFYRHSKLTRTQ